MPHRVQALYSPSLSALYLLCRSYKEYVPENQSHWMTHRVSGFDYPIGSGRGERCRDGFLEQLIGIRVRLDDKDGEVPRCVVADIRQVQRLGLDDIPFGMGNQDSRPKRDRRRDAHRRVPQERRLVWMFGEWVHMRYRRLPIVTRCQEMVLGDTCPQER